jgi:hypothetical protein
MLQTEGNPINGIQEEREQRKYKGPSSVALPVEVQRNSADHWLQWNRKRNRCKLPHARVSHLCLTRNDVCESVLHQRKNIS